MSSDPHAAARSRMSRIRQQLQSAVRETGLHDVVKAVNQTSEKLRHAPSQIGQLEGRGYRFSTVLSSQAQALQAAWTAATQTIHQDIQQAVASLQPEATRVQGLVGQAESLVTNPDQFNTASALAEQAVRALENQTKMAEETVRRGFSAVQTAVEMFEQHLKDANETLDELKEASITLNPDESVIMACKIEWAATGKGGDDPDGNIYLTDKRLVFEQKEKKGKFLGLFGGKQVQGQLWAVELSQITGMTADKKGLFGGRKMLLLGLAEGAPYPELPLEVKDGFGNERLAELIRRAQAGQFGAPIDVGGGVAVQQPPTTNPEVATPSAPMPAPATSGGVGVVVPVGGGQTTPPSAGQGHVVSETTRQQGAVPTTVEELLAGMTWKTFTPTDDYFTVVVERDVNDGRDNFTSETDPIYLPSFTISALPVTKAEFNVFLNAPDGARLRKWWEYSFEAIRDYNLPAPATKDLHLTCGGLNYWAAMAYCLWLSAKTGEFFRLPLEAEWQHAIFDGITFFHGLREWVFEWGRGSEYAPFVQFLPPYVEPAEQNYQGKNSRTAPFYPQYVKPSVNWLIKQGEQFFPRRQALIPLATEPALGFRLVRTGQPYTDVLADIDTNLDDVPALLASITTMWKGFLKLARAASPQAVQILVDLIDSGKMQPSNPLMILGWISDRTDIPLERLMEALPSSNDALTALSLVPMAKKLPLLQEALANGSDSLRSRALLAFRSVDPAVKLQIFVDKLNNDSSANVRDTAARLIGKIQLPEALHALVQKRTDPDLKVAKAIQQSIEDLKKAMPDVVIDAQPAVARTSPDQWAARTVQPPTFDSTGDAPAIVWLDVPAGTHEHQQFIAGEMREGIAPQHIKRMVDLPAYKISQTAVTRAQWYAFLVAPDGYQDNRWWEFSTAAMEGKRFAVWTQPPTNPDAPQTGLLYETMLAFCMWMSHKLGQTVTIPSLAELDYAELTLGSAFQAPTDDAPEVTITNSYKDENQLTLSATSRYIRGVRRNANQSSPHAYRQQKHGFRLIITDRELKPQIPPKSAGEYLQTIIEAANAHTMSGVHSLAPYVAILRDASTIPVLMEMMFHEAKHVRHSAYFIAKWVARELPLPIEPMIEALIAEPVVDKRGNLSTALGLIGADALPHLEKLIGHDEALIRAEAIAALGVHLYTEYPADSRVLAALIGALKDPFEGNVIKAIEWLSGLPDESVKAAIAALVGDSRLKVSKHARNALNPA